jgi:hypothetical protein
MTKEINLKTLRRAGCPLLLRVPNIITKVLLREKQEDQSWQKNNVMMIVEGKISM